MPQLEDHFFRESAGKLTAVLTQQFGLKHTDRILDVVQDTFEAALHTWKHQGIPKNPLAWLMKVARNKAINMFKRDAKTALLTPEEFVQRHDQRVTGDWAEISLSAQDIRDAQLRLLLCCCDGQYKLRNQVIFTLYVVCGFGMKEIANALLMQEEAVKKALTRMKQKWRETEHLPKANLSHLNERIDAVLTVLYLMFNEGYKTTKNDSLLNHDLCFEAVRLIQFILSYDTCRKADAHALLALLFFNIARFPSRVDAFSEFIGLAEQDRSKWDHRFIRAGYMQLEAAATGNSLSRYHLEAIIASIHCSAPSFEKTDWNKIAQLYQQLQVIDPSPSVTLSHIMANSYLVGAHHGLEELDAMKEDPTFARHHLYYATIGHLLDRLEQKQTAVKAYEKAYELAHSPHDRRFLMKKIKSISPNVK